MPSDLHAVKLAAETAVLRQYGLEKAAVDIGAGVRRLFTWKSPGVLPEVSARFGRNTAIGGALSTAAGALGGGLRGYYQGGQPRPDGTQPTHEERVEEAKRQALKGGLAVGGLGTAATALHGLRPQLGWIGRGALEVGRDAIFGSPLTLWDKIKRHQERAGGSLAKGIGTVARDWWWYTPKDLSLDLGSAAHLGLQGYQLYHPLKDLYQGATSENKDERLGNIAAGVTGLAAMPFTTRLGLAGMPIQSALESGARGLVSKKKPAYDFQYDPATHAQQSIRGLRGLRGDIDVPIEAVSGLDFGQ